MKVLIVDDDVVTLEMLRNILEDEGYEVVTAWDGAEALERLRSERCGIVVSDWSMPQMNGLELCRAVRSEDLAGYIYFILVTCHGETEHAVEGLSAGADDFIRKPFSPAELAVRVRAGERILGLETRDVALFAMAKLAESRDPETGAHLDRVRLYARILSEEMSQMDGYRESINASFCQMIYRTSPLHDIGKVGIPDTVLLKPGRLSDREFELMKRHTVIGAQTLDAALKMMPGASFLTMARDIAMGHHEWFDGSGYPEGLSGEDIPLAARIAGLADVYDALTTRRVYKDAIEHDVARSIIIEESGTHFDPCVVEAFLAGEQQFIFTREQLCDEAPEMASSFR